MTGRIIAAHNALEAGLRLLKEKEGNALTCNHKWWQEYNKGIFPHGIHTLTAQERIRIQEMLHSNDVMLFLYEAMITMMGNYTEKLGSLMQQTLGNESPSIRKLSAFNKNIDEYTKKHHLKPFPQKGKVLAQNLYDGLYTQRNTVAHELEELSMFRGVTIGPTGTNYQWPGKFKTDSKKIEEMMGTLENYTQLVAHFININT